MLTCRSIASFPSVMTRWVTEGDEKQAVTGRALVERAWSASVIIIEYGASRLLWTCPSLVLSFPALSSNRLSRNAFRRSGGRRSGSASNSSGVRPSIIISSFLRLIAESLRKIFWMADCVFDRDKQVLVLVSDLGGPQDRRTGSLGSKNLPRNGGNWDKAAAYSAVGLTANSGDSVIQGCLRWML